MLLAVLLASVTLPAAPCAQAISSVLTSSSSSQHGDPSKAGTSVSTGRVRPEVGVNCQQLMDVARPNVVSDGNRTTHGVV